MDDFRVGSISPYDPIHRQGGENTESRKRRKHSDRENVEAEDVVSLSETAEAEDSGSTYSPTHEPGNRD